MPPGTGGCVPDLTGRVGGGNNGRNARRFGRNSRWLSERSCDARVLRASSCEVGSQGSPFSATQQYAGIMLMLVHAHAKRLPHSGFVQVGQHPATALAPPLDFIT